jgi:hypothetical protein
MMAKDSESLKHHKTFSSSLSVFLPSTVLFVTFEFKGIGSARGP